MNIFVTSPCPIQSAQYLDDKRIPKMVLESAQMLCTAIVHHGGDAPYKPTHKNHPCNVWCRQTRENFFWLYKHYIALSKEYTLRFGKVHKSSTIAKAIISQAHRIPEGPLTNFANCAANDGKGINYKHITDVHKAYQLYLMDRWETDARQPTWHRKG